MIKRLGALALLVASPAVAQSAPYKLLLIWNGQGGAVVTDYPSKARCEAAVAAIRAEVARRNALANKPEALPGGGYVTTLPTGALAFCFPG